MEYQIQANTRRCTATGRELSPGERFYSVLVEEGAKLVRKDYSEQAWSGPPREAFGFWAGRVPAPDAARRPRVDDDLLMECFHRLEGQEIPDRLHFRYVVALLLMRRKRLRFEEARVEDGEEVLYLRCTTTREPCRVVNPRMTEEQMNAVQDEVFQVLGWE